MFNKILFWCEFPDRIDWEKLDFFFRNNEFTADIGIVCTSRADYDEKLAKLSKLSNIRLKMAWPVLSKEKGYWFSSQTDKEDIDSLDQYKGMKIKLDIEPRIPKISSYKSNQWKMNFWLFRQLFMRGKNRKYLQEKIRELSRTTEILLSSFSFPDFILKRMGMVFDKNLQYNYIFYSSFVPKYVRWLYRIYMRSFIKKKLKFNSETYFAVGLLSPGIFNDEPAYKSYTELDSDMKFLLDNKAKNCVIFRLGSFQELENPEKWLSIIRKYL